MPDMQNMAYDEKFRARAVAFKNKGHTFEELKEVFGIFSHTYYKWQKNKEKTGFYAPKSEKRTRKRKIDPEELKLAVKEKPDVYLRELAEKFECSLASVHNRLIQLGITLKKRRLLILKNLKGRERNTLKKSKKSRSTSLFMLMRAALIAALSENMAELLEV
jgi:transposase